MLNTINKLYNKYIENKITCREFLHESNKFLRSFEDDGIIQDSIISSTEKLALMVLRKNHVI
ncbi:MAG: hypothetical protein ACTSXL_02520 [Alphaproteobacteria bacterium]